MVVEETPVDHSYIGGTATRNSAASGYGLDRASGSARAGYAFLKVGRIATIDQVAVEVGDLDSICAHSQWRFA